MPRRRTDARGERVDGPAARDAGALSRSDTRAADADVRVRIGTPDDLDTVLAFRLALLREHAGNPVYGRLRDDAPERARRLFAAQLVAPGEVTFLAERGGRPIGVLRCMESRGSPLLDPARYGYVASVYVVPEERRRGVLRVLLDAAAEWCADRSLDEMRLHTASDNDVGNAAWDALGFTVVEHLRTRSLTPRR